MGCASLAHESLLYWMLLFYLDLARPANTCNLPSFPWMAPVHHAAYPQIKVLSPFNLLLLLWYAVWCIGTIWGKEAGGWQQSWVREKGSKQGEGENNLASCKPPCRRHLKMVLKRKPIAQLPQQLGNICWQICKALQTRWPRWLSKGSY